MPGPYDPKGSRLARARAKLYIVEDALEAAIFNLISFRMANPTSSDHLHPAIVQLKELRTHVRAANVVVHETIEEAQCVLS